MASVMPDPRLSSQPQNTATAPWPVLITFRVKRSRCEMYIGHGPLSACPSLHSRTILYGPGCNLGNGSGCHRVVHYWTDLQLVDGLCCYDNIAPNAKYQRVLILALCLVSYLTEGRKLSVPDWLVIPRGIAANGHPSQY